MGFYSSPSKGEKAKMSFALIRSRKEKDLLKTKKKGRRYAKGGTSKLRFHGISEMKQNQPVGGTFCVSCRWWTIGTAVHLRPTKSAR